MEAERQMAIRPRFLVVVCLAVFAAITAFAEDAAGNRARSNFRFVDAASAAPIKPRSVQIDGHEISEYVETDGSVIIESDPGEYYIVVIADGYRVMRARHTAAAGESPMNTFHLVTDSATDNRRNEMIASSYQVSGWVRSADDHSGIACASVVFESDSLRVETESDANGVYRLSLPADAFDHEWRLTATAAGWESRALAGEGSSELPSSVSQVFLLFSVGGTHARSSQRIALLRASESELRLRVLATQAPPNAISVGLGSPLQTAQTCSGMNAKCSSSFNACTGGIDTIDTETYVKRVFRGELFGTTIWNDAQLENFKAMAVAIRSYASYRALNNRRGTQYDICNSDSCQCYFSGFSSFGPISTSASEQTAGQVMLGSTGQVGNTEYGAWNGPCSRGITHCSAESGYPNVLPIYDYAIDQNWSLRPSDPATWGHGHGLSQYGSHFRAKTGESYSTILNFYYRDYGWQLGTGGGSGGGSSPAAPTGLGAVALSSSSIRFSWTDNSNNEAGFGVFRWDGSTWVRIATVGENVTSYTDTGLQASTTYYHTVCAHNSAGPTCAGTYSTATTQSSNTNSRPAAPSGLNAAALSSTSIRFSWIDNANNEAGFGVFRWDGTTWLKIASVGANITSYSDTGLQPSTTYFHTVCAHNSAGASCAGTYSTASTQGSNVTPPLAPSNPTAVALSSSSIRFSWTDNANNEAGFGVFRWDGSTWVRIATVSANSTSYTDTGLQPLTTYYHTVCAHNSAGANCAGTYSTAMTQSASTATLPAAPSSLSAAALSSSSIRFSWVDNANNETGFGVFRWDGATWVRIATLGSNATSYTDTGLQPSTTYYHTVCAHNSVGANCAGTYSTAATQASTTLPAAPSGLSAAPRSSSSIAFSWFDNSYNETGFKVFRWNGVSWVWIGTVGGNITTFTDTGLSSRTTYYHTVCAVNSAGGNCASDYSTATTF